jgi:hypothetical protein
LYNSAHPYPQLANKIVEDRKKHPIEKKDLLNAMLLGKDPQTGEFEVSIRGDEYILTRITQVKDSVRKMSRLKCSRF